MAPEKVPTEDIETPKKERSFKVISAEVEATFTTPTIIPKKAPI